MFFRLNNAGPCRKAAPTKVAAKLGNTRVLCELSNLLLGSLPSFFLTVKIMFSLASAEQVGGCGVVCDIFLF